MVKHQTKMNTGLKIKQNSCSSPLLLSQLSLKRFNLKKPTEQTNVEMLTVSEEKVTHSQVACHSEAVPITKYVAAATKGTITVQDKGLSEAAPDAPVLGHETISQVPVSDNGLQPAPVRVRVFVPRPQDTEQEDHGPHVEQPPAGVGLGFVGGAGFGDPPDPPPLCQFAATWAGPLMSRYGKA